MFEVFVWVPSKGWKLVYKTKDQKKATERALEFVPLEVKLSTPSGRSYHSGVCHTPLDKANWLEQIEQYAKIGRYSKV